MFNVWKELKSWREERGLDKVEYIHKDEVMKDVEETFELMGYVDTDPLVEHFIDNAYVHCLEPSDEEKVDAHCDKIIFAINAIEALGYNAKKCMSETVKEISSRTGSIVEGSTKWQKFKTTEAMALWYTADYARCKRN